MLTCCILPEAELKLPQVQKDLPVGLQKEGAQGLLPLPAPYHSSGPPVTPGQAPQQADVANDSKSSPLITMKIIMLILVMMIIISINKASFNLRLTDCFDRPKRSTERENFKTLKKICGLYLKTENLVLKTQQI